jgi:phospholipid/cholesterol/gamma-HCH transport system substrate-binding protein
LPSQRQLRWSQLRVGITVLVASITLGVLIFLMTGSTGLFTKKITLRAYFDSAGGLRVGAPVRLQDVDLGNVQSIRVVSDPKRKSTPVEVRMKVGTRYLSNLHKDSVVSLNTAGVLGETYVDIDSTKATKGPVSDGDELPTEEKPDLNDVVKSTQTTMANVQVLLKRADNIMSTIENGQGTIGKLITDDELYRRFNSTVREFQGIAEQVNSGNGSIGKFLYDEQLYNKANATVDKLNGLLDQVNSGHGTLGKFVKDETLYNNARDITVKANRLMDDVNAGKGTIGKLARDEQFAAKVDNTVTKLNTLMDRLEAGEGTAGKFLKDPALYNNANTMLVESRSLIKAIREHPKTYLTIHLKIF